MSLVEYLKILGLVCIIAGIVITAIIQRKEGDSALLERQLEELYNARLGTLTVFTHYTAQDVKRTLWAFASDFYYLNGKDQQFREYSINLFNMTKLLAGEYAGTYGGVEETRKSDEEFAKLFSENTDIKFILDSGANILRNKMALAFGKVAEAENNISNLKIERANKAKSTKTLSLLSFWLSIGGLIFFTGAETFTKIFLMLWKNLSSHS